LKSADSEGQSTVTDDFVVTVERGHNYSEVRVPFEGDTTEHAERCGRVLADLIERMFPDGVADEVIAGLVAARLEGQLDESEFDDPDFELTFGAQADISKLHLAMIPALGRLGVAVKFDDV
jgi:hypothetical protein